MDHRCNFASRLFNIEGLSIFLIFVFAELGPRRSLECFPN